MLLDAAVDAEASQCFRCDRRSLWALPFINKKIILPFNQFNVWSFLIFKIIRLAGGRIEFDIVGCSGRAVPAELLDTHTHTHTHAVTHRHSNTTAVGLANSQH